MIRYLSFDLDGTITKRTYADAVWLEGLPLLYAKQYNITYQAAQRHIIGEYDKIGEGRIEWYDISYWYDRFGLRHDWKGLLDQYRDRVEVYPESHDVIKRLSRYHPLVIISNARREFIDIQLQEAGLLRYFKHVFSSTSDFQMMKNSPSFYKMICDRLEVKPSEIIHIGDHEEFDYKVPRSIGIPSFYLDRSGTCNGEGVVHDLREYEDILTNGILKRVE